MGVLGYLEIESRIIDKDNSIGIELCYVFLTKANIAEYGFEM